MDTLDLALDALCAELGLKRPTADARGRYSLAIGDLQLRLGPWGRSEVMLEGVIGRMASDAAAHWEEQQAMLRHVLTWNLARLKGQARPEVLSFDEEENTLLLWRSWPAVMVTDLLILQAAEEMLNELEFWRAKIRSIAPEFGQEKSSA